MSESSSHESFVFYKSWVDIIEKKYGNKPDIKKKLYLAIIQYGIRKEATYPAEDMFLMQVYAQIDSAHAKHDARVEAGRKGGQNGKGDAKARPKNKNASKRKQTQPNVNDNVNANVNANDNIINTSPGIGPSDEAQPVDDDYDWRDPSDI